MTDTEPSYLYEYGMYGGKFFPLHKGHAYCIDRCCQECKHAYIILFINGTQERAYRPVINEAPYLTPEYREAQCRRYLSRYPNAELKVIDVRDLIDENGDEDWLKEVGIIRTFIPRLDAIYGSEPGYSNFFKDNYPEAQNILVDVDRCAVPMSATKLRAMIRDGNEEWKEWII